MKLSHMEFIKTSLPFTFSTMAASLMGAVDTAVVGHLGNYTYINAVSLGAVIFSTVYWLFGFLKISTSGFAAQALGQHDRKLLAGAFIRGVLAAFGIGFHCHERCFKLSDFVSFSLSGSEDERLAHNGFARWQRDGA